MERDARRDPGQWRGCYSFKDIVCDDDSGAGLKRNGGLKMGHTYYYYVSSYSSIPLASLLTYTQYELDGSHETHDPTLPSTTHCPYLPGQMVNKLEVPIEKVLRQRSASLSSMNTAEFRTMNPSDKYITPRPAPRAPDGMWSRLGSSPQPRSSNSSRAASPASSWRRLFRLRSSSRGSDRGRSLESDDRSYTPDFSTDETRSVLSSHGTRSRDISPESLRRFLVDDTSAPAATPGVEEWPTLSIPEDIAEEVEDDDNFATSAVSENNPFPTSLAPPPFKRSHSDSSMPTITNGSQMTLTEYVAATSDREERVPSSPSLGHPKTAFALPTSRFSMSTAPSSVISDDLPSTEDETPSFYDSNDDDDVLSSKDGDASSFQPLSLLAGGQPSPDGTHTPFPSYSLPRPDAMDSPKTSVPLVSNQIGSPQLIARSDTGIPLGNTSLLAAPGDHGIDDFVSEMNWMVDIIRGKPA